MRAKLIPLAILVTTSLCSGVLVVTSAQAEALKPQGNWAVSKVSAKQEGGTPYCALARRFGNGSILTFARNSFDETSVAVDLPKGTFKTGQSYTIVFDPGQGESRSYQTQPISERGLVVRMGRDDKFYSALEESGQLAINVDDKSFTFSMPDMKDGTQNLGACLGAGTEPAAGTPKDEPKEAAVKVEEPTKIVEVKPEPKKQETASVEQVKPVAIAEPVKLAVAPVVEEKAVADITPPGMEPAAEDVLAAAPMQQGPIPSAEKIIPGKPVEQKIVEVVPVPEKVAIAAPEPKTEPKKIEAETVLAASPVPQEEKAISGGDHPPVVLKEAAAIAEDQEKVSLAANLEHAETQSVREENTRLRNAIERDRRIYEEKMQQADSEGASVAQMTQKLRMLEVENTELRTKAEEAAQIAANAMPPVPTPVSVTVAEPVVVQDPQAGALKEANSTLKTELKSLQDKIAMLEQEKTLSKTTTTNDADTSKQLADAQSRALESDAVVAGLTEQIHKLMADNETLKTSLAAKPVEHAVAAPATTVDMSETVAALGRLKAMESRMALLKAERDNLADELAGLKKATNDGRVKISSDNWNLEQSTKRFNEAELEIRRLGTVMEQERAKCTVDKKELEYMLFDPKIADKQQISKLISLEAELDQAKKELAKKGGGDQEKVSALESTLAAQTQKLTAAEARAKELEQQLASAKTAMTGSAEDKGKLASYESNIKVLEEKLASATQESATLRKDLEDARKMAGSANEQTMAMNSLKQQILGLNDKVQNLQKDKAAMVEHLAQINTASGSAAVETKRPAPAAIPVSTPVSAPVSTATPAMAQVNPSAVVETTNVQPPSDKTLASATGMVVKAEMPGASDQAKPQSISRKPLETSVPLAEVQSSKAALPVPAIAAAVATPQIKMMQPKELEGLLSRAGVSVLGGVQPVASATGAGRVAYRWKSGGLMGTAEQKAMESPSQFDTFVTEYLSKTKSRCGGEFAASPSTQSGTAVSQTAAYEIACVDGGSGAGASAALIFESRDGLFTAIANETNPESMDLAMDARDKIAGAMTSGKTASR